MGFDPWPYPLSCSLSMTTQAFLRFAAGGGLEGGGLHRALRAAPARGRASGVSANVLGGGGGGVFWEGQDCVGNLRPTFCDTLPVP